MCHSALHELWVLLHCCCCTGKHRSWAFFSYFFPLVLCSRLLFHLNKTIMCNAQTKHINQLRRTTPLLNKPWDCAECVCVQCSWLFALSCAARAAKYVELAEIKKERPHSYQAMFVERCQYLLYYKSYVDLSTTTLITLGLEMLTLTQHGSEQKIRAGKWTEWGWERERERKKKRDVLGRAAFRCVPKRYTTCFSRILMYRDIMNHTTADSIHRFPFRLKQQKLQKLFAHTIQNILR